MDRTFFALAALLAALAVGLGAFGAHALESRLTPDLLQTYETAVRYHFYHVFALFITVFAIGRWPESSLGTTAGWLFVAGLVLFSGSLYLLTLTGTRWLGAITPIGGVAFIAGWLCLAWLAFRA